MSPLRLARALAARADIARDAGLSYALRSAKRDLEQRRAATERRERLVRRLWEDAAAELGATVTDLPPFFYEIAKGDASTRVLGQTVMLNDEVSARLAEDKTAVNRLLTSAGLAIPELAVIDGGGVTAAEAFLSAAPEPCVVKPAAGSGGDGVTGEVRRPAQLRRALRAAFRYSDRAVVERQVPGEVFRVLVLDGEMLDVIRRSRPTVTGDGRSTIAKLILDEYGARVDGAEDAEALKPFRVDLDCLFTLAAQGLSPRAVPGAGEVVTVKTVTNANRRADNEAVKGPFPASFTAPCAAAAEALGLRLAGVDVISLSKDDDPVIVDVNPVPALHHHQRVANREEAVSVAVPILRTLLAESEQRRRHESEASGGPAGLSPQ